MIGQRLLARVHAATSKLFWRGQLINSIHVKNPATGTPIRRIYSSDIAAYALRDLDALHRRVATYGPTSPHTPLHCSITRCSGARYARLYPLHGLVHRHGADAVHSAFQRAFDIEAINVGLIDRMLTRGRGPHNTLSHRPTSSGPDCWPMHGERADELFKRLRAARLDHTHNE